MDCSSAIIGSRLKQWTLDKTSFVGGQKKKVGAVIGGKMAAVAFLSPVFFEAVTPQRRAVFPTGMPTYRHS